MAAGPIADLIKYTTSLGARDTPTSVAGAARVLDLRRSEAHALINLHRRLTASCVVPEVSEADFTEAQTIRVELVQRIDALLDVHTASDDTHSWFFKTNRHSCKDAPLAHPTDADTALFREELLRLGGGALPVDMSPDAVNFGPAFEAFCIARLRATRVRTGEEAVSLLVRSKMAHDDLELQLSHTKEGWDCYLAFIPFSEEIAATPLHEFRCFVSGRIVRCVAQYSHFVACPIHPSDMPGAGAACVELVESLLPSLPSSIVDLAVDVRCLQRPDRSGFDVSLIELNPLGPGCVWGVVDWARDRDWLLGKTAPPFNVPRTIRDNVGNVTQCVPSLRGEAMVRFTSEHAPGFSMGGLAHIPAPFLIILYELWGLDRLLERERAQKQQAHSRRQLQQNHHHHHEHNDKPTAIQVTAATTGQGNTQCTVM